MSNGSDSPICIFFEFSASRVEVPKLKTGCIALKRAKTTLSEVVEYILILNVEYITKIATIYISWVTDFKNEGVEAPKGSFYLLEGQKPFWITNHEYVTKISKIFVYRVTDSKNESLEALKGSPYSQIGLKLSFQGYLFH